MIVFGEWNIHSLAASVGFDQTKSADLAREYFLLQLIKSFSFGGAIGSEAICHSEQFQKYRDYYQMTFAFPEQGTDPAFWARLDLLLELFEKYNLFEFDCFQREVCPWMIADQSAFDAVFPGIVSTGKRVAALALLLRLVGQADADNIAALDPAHFYMDPGIEETWMRITRLSGQEFVACWMALFSHEHQAIPVKVNSRIADAIGAYRQEMVPMQKLLSDFSDIKKYRSQLDV